MYRKGVSINNMDIIRGISLIITVQRTTVSRREDNRIAIEELMTVDRNNTFRIDTSYRFRSFKEEGYTTETSRFRVFCFSYFVIYDSIFKVTSCFFTAFRKLVSQFITDTIFLNGLRSIGNRVSFVTPYFYGAWSFLPRSHAFT
jgi:hypothetical protein